MLNYENFSNLGQIFRIRGIPCEILGHIQPDKSIVVL